MKCLASPSYRIISYLLPVWGPCLFRNVSRLMENPHTFLKSSLHVLCHFLMFSLSQCVLRAGSAWTVLRCAHVLEISTAVTMSLGNAHVYLDTMATAVIWVRHTVFCRYRFYIDICGSIPRLYLQLCNQPNKLVFIVVQSDQKIIYNWANRQWLYNHTHYHSKNLRSERLFLIRNKYFYLWRSHWMSEKWE